MFSWSSVSMLLVLVSGGISRHIVWPSFNSHMFYHLGAMAVHQVAVRIPTFVYVHTSPPPRVFPYRWLRSTQKSCRPMIWKAEFGMLLFNQVSVRQSTARLFISQKTPYLWWSKSILLLRAQMFARNSVGIGGLLAFSLASELACLLASEHSASSCCSSRALLHQPSVLRSHNLPSVVLSCGGAVNSVNRHNTGSSKSCFTAIIIITIYPLFIWTALFWSLPTSSCICLVREKDWCSPTWQQ